MNQNLDLDQNFEMSSYEMVPGKSRYDTTNGTNNIVVVGNTPKPRELVPKQDLPSVKLPVPCKVPRLPGIPYQSYNSGLTMPPFNQNAVQQYWTPTPSYATPPAVSSFHWGQRYEGAPELQNGHRSVVESGHTIHNNQPYATGHITHDCQPFAVEIGEMVHSNVHFSVRPGEIVHNSQHFVVGPGEMVNNNQHFAAMIHNSQHFAVGTGEMVHNSQPFAVGPGEIVYNNQPFAVRPGEIVNNSQPFAIGPGKIIHNSQSFAVRPSEIVQESQAFAVGPGEMVHNSQPFAVGPGEMVHSSQPSVVGPVEIVYNSQPFPPGTENMAHGSQPFATGTCEMAHNSNQPYDFGTGQMAKVSQHRKELINEQVPVSQNNRSTLESLQKHQNSNICNVPSPCTEPFQNSTTAAEKNTLKYARKMTPEPEKVLKLNSDDSITGAVNPTRSETPVREENKSPVECTQSHWKINNKIKKDKEIKSPHSPLPRFKLANGRDENKSPVECTQSHLKNNNKMKEEKEIKSPHSPLQRIKFANGKIIKSKCLESAFDEDKQETNGSSSSYKIKINKFQDTVMAAEKEHIRKSSSGGSNISKQNAEFCNKEVGRDSEYCNKEVGRSTVKNKLPDKVITKKFVESKVQPKKSNKKRSALIEKLKLKLQKVDEEIRKRQIDLTIKNKLIKEELTSIKSKDLNSNDYNNCVTKKKISKDEEANSHSESRECIKSLTKVQSEAYSIKKETQLTKKNMSMETKTQTDGAGKISLKKQVKSVVNVVKCLKNSDLRKSQHDTANCRTHREKYYIIRQKDLKRSIHNTPKTAKETHSSLSKCKIKCQNTVFNTKHDDLLIMFNNENGDELEQSQERKVKVQKRKNIDENDNKEHLQNPAKLRKIELIINVVTKTSEQDIDRSSESEQFMDLSFLDDINADEIVEYLNSSEKQANCESDISHITHNSSDVHTATTSSSTVSINESIDIQRYEPIVDRNLDDTMIINVRKEGRPTSLSNNEIETEKETPDQSVDKTLAPIPEIFMNNQQLLSPDESPALISDPICNVSKDDLNDSPTCSEINNNNRTSQEKSSLMTCRTLEFINVELARFNAADPCSVARVGNDLNKSVMIIEEKHPDVITITEKTNEVITIADKSKENITITNVGMARCNTGETSAKLTTRDDLEKSVMVIKEKQPDVITIADDTEEIITIADVSKEVVTITDETEEVITITDEAEEIITIIDDSQKCIAIKNKPTTQIPTAITRDNVKISKINTSKEKTSALMRIKVQNCITKNAIQLKGHQENKKERQVKVELKEPEEFKVQKPKVKEELLNITEVPRDMLQDVIKDEPETCVLGPSQKIKTKCNKEDVSVKSKNDSCTSEDKIGDKSVNIKDMVAEIKTPNISIEEKEVKKESARLETTNNNKIPCSKTDIEQCNKSPCKELHKIIEKQEASKKVQKFTVTKVKNTLVKTKKSIFTQRYTEKMKALAEKGRGKELKTKAYLDLMASWEKEVALALKLEERVSDYLNLDLLVCSVLHRGTFSIMFNCVDPEGLHVTAKIIKDSGNTSTNTKTKQVSFRDKMMSMKLQDTIPKDKLDLVFLANGLKVDGRWCLLMDYYPKNLEQALRESGRGLHITLVHKLAKQLVSAVQTLRNNGVVHSDIKPTHILLDANNTTLKLCGFDESYYVIHAQKVSNIGTIHYRAPEVILGHSASFSIDVWATAAVLYEMATSQKLFPGTSNNEVLYQHLSTLGNAPWPMVQSSAFKNAHYVRHMFRRRYFSTENNVTKMFYQDIPNFPKTDRVVRSLLKSYTSNWSKVEKDNDVMKLHQLNSLLSRMLVLDPNIRISILNANIK